MAIIRIYNREADAESLPSICMRCGADSEKMVRQTFAWMPSWVNVLILFGLLPWLVVALVTRKSFHLTAPMCDRHVNHWRVRKLYIWVGLFCWIAFIVALIMMSKNIPEQFLTPLIGFCVFGFLAWLIAGLLLTNGAIRAIEITDFGIDLTNVNRAFADEWEIICDKADGERRAKRKR
jgi:hypothetical protein